MFSKYWSKSRYITIAQMNSLLGSLVNSHYDSMNPRGMWEGFYLRDYFISGKAIIIVQSWGKITES